MVLSDARYRHCIWCYAMPRTDTAYGAIRLRPCHAVPSTDLVYSAMRCPGTDIAYGAMRSPY
eukprot:2199151-Rhodomonas_salina.1